MKVSVIIPVYNTEKFLPVCLESLAIQTMRDFEVVIVDDCSTDNSVAVAESYLERFGGRLKVIMLDRNTGSGAVPRNIGLEHARGEYIFFADSDDLLIDNALEIFVEAADTYKADVVYTEGCFACDDEFIPKNLRAAEWSTEFAIDKPVLETDNFAKHVKDFVEVKVRWTPWLKFLRRDFLIDNDIKFPPVKICEDGIWTFELLCLSKRWLRIPTPLYIYRDRSDSQSSRKRSPKNFLQFWMNPFADGLEHLNNFMNRFVFFDKHHDYRVRVLNALASPCFPIMADAFKELSPREVFEIFMHEFNDDKHAVLISYLLFIATVYRNELTK